MYDSLHDIRHRLFMRVCFLCERIVHSYYLRVDRVESFLSCLLILQVTKLYFYVVRYTVFTCYNVALSCQQIKPVKSISIYLLLIMWIEHQIKTQTSPWMNHSVSVVSYVKYSRGFKIMIRGKKWRGMAARDLSGG